MDTEKLLKLSELKDKGAITEEEFQVMKKAILDDAPKQVNVAESTSQKSESFSVWKIVLGFFGIIFVLGVISGINNSDKSGSTTKSHAEDDFDDEGVNADLIEMFDEKKENEYSFTQKYSNKELTFKAKVYGIKSDCYIKNVWADKHEYIPCVELAHPTREIQIFGLATAVANARMQDERVISTLKKNQKIKLTCTLGKSTFDLVSFVFDNCRLYEKKTNINNKAPDNTISQASSKSNNTDFRDIDWVNATYNDIIKVIDSGADINQKFEEGTTVLMLAVDMGANPQAIQALLDKGADVNAKKDYGETVLHSAAYQDNPKIIEVLVKNGADVNASEQSGMTPLMLAAKDNKNPQIIETLITLGADINAKSGDMSAIDYAAYGNKNPAIIETLIKLGAQFDENTITWAEENENPNIEMILKRYLQHNPNATKTKSDIHNNSEADEVVWNDGSPQNVNQAYENASYDDKILFEETFEECIAQQKLNQAFMDSLSTDMKFQMAFSGGSDTTRQCKCIFQAARKYLGNEEYNKVQTLRKQGRDGSADKILKQAIPAAFGECF